MPYLEDLKRDLLVSLDPQKVSSVSVGRFDVR